MRFVGYVESDGMVPYKRVSFVNRRNSIDIWHASVPKLLQSGLCQILLGLAQVVSLLFEVSGCLVVVIASGMVTVPTERLSRAELRLVTPSACSFLPMLL